MKKIFTIAIVLAFLGNLSAQTIVSTEVENRNAVLEEFGGIYCTFCPDGHAIGEQIKNQYGDDVVLINIQEGGFAAPAGSDPDFRTEYGPAIDGQTGLVGYPAGTVNRRNFPGREQGAAGSTAMSRGDWAFGVGQVTAEVSPVNIAGEATFDLGTGMVDVLVEVYYTGDAPAAMNMLNIGLLQNNIIGPQTGGGMGDNYVHKHMLRDLLTGQWGEEITETTAGSFHSFTYSYELPAEVRNIPIDPSNIEMFAFVSEGSQNILSGTNIAMSFNVEFANNANVLSASTVDVICGDEITPSVSFRNDGNDDLTALTVTYSINGGDESTYEWEGSLATFEAEEVELPAISFIPVEEGSNELSVTVSNPNAAQDENEDNNTTVTTFENAAVANTVMVEVEIRTDQYGYETYWEMRDENGAVFASGGNTNVGPNGGGDQSAGAGDPGAYGNNQTISEMVEVPAEGCFDFVMVDDWGDGICCQYGNGFYNLKDADGELLLSGGSFGGDISNPFRYTMLVSTDDLILNNDISVFPNPASDVVNIRFDLLEDAAMDVSIHNAIGQKVLTLGSTNYNAGRHNLEANVAKLQNGIYFVQFNTTEGTVSRKIVINK